MARTRSVLCASVPRKGGTRVPNCTDLRDNSSVGPGSSTSPSCRVLLALLSAVACASVLVAVATWVPGRDRPSGSGTSHSDSRGKSDRYGAIRGEGDAKATGVRYRDAGDTAGGARHFARAAESLSLAQYVHVYPSGDEGPDGGFVRARAQGRGFRWTFDYPGPDGRFDTEDDRSDEPVLRVPVGTPVMLTITSSDYLYSFNVPDLGIKQIAVPKLTHLLNFRIDKVGQFELLADPLCGFRLFHEKYMGQLLVEDRESFDAWRYGG